MKLSAKPFVALSGVREAELTKLHGSEIVGYSLRRVEDWEPKFLNRPQRLHHAPQPRAARFFALPVVTEVGQAGFQKCIALLP